MRAVAFKKMGLGEGEGGRGVKTWYLIQVGIT